ncbi:7008_t:CDS:1, partial [Rhizophagus irregularis]
MAEYTLKRFSGRADENIDEFIKDYRLHFMAANITTANAGGKQRALELFRSCLTDEALRWIENRLIQCIQPSPNKKIFKRQIFYIM